MDWALILLVGVRDALVALALAWVGVSIEPRSDASSVQCAEAASGCIGEDASLRVRLD